MKSDRILVGTFAFAFGHLLMLAACVPATPAETAYTAAQLRCVDTSVTWDDAQACRLDVDRRWGVKR